MTVSIGLSTFAPNGDEREFGMIYTELFKRADKALYMAKEQGRNRVRHAGAGLMLRCR